MSTPKGWIGVDLDGTLAYYDGWRGAGHIGEPIPLMAERVKAWIAKGQEVRIVTARVADGLVETKEAIDKWCLEHLGTVLPITRSKDMTMIELWDDRCVQVDKNTGIDLLDHERKILAAVSRERDELRQLIVDIGNLSGARVTSEVSHEFLKLVRGQVQGKIAHLQDRLKELEDEIKDARKSVGNPQGIF